MFVPQVSTRAYAFWKFGGSRLGRYSSNITLQVLRTKPGESKLVEEMLPPLNSGDVLLKVDNFALTANTATYATVGEKFGYWDFYPTVEKSTWGCVPAIGWATVVESKNPKITIGGKYFGWYPMSKYVRIAAKEKHDGFRDVGEHRKAHAPVYVDFTRTEHDPYYVDKTADGEARQALLRGLFLTSFLADEFLAEARYFNANNVVIVSASSKTAIGLAQRLSIRKQNLGLRVIGLTAGANSMFVRSTGFYDEVISYDNVELLSSIQNAVVVDMAGNWKLIDDIHYLLGERIKYSMSIGFSHHEAGVAPKKRIIKGPEPKLFFAPVEVVKRAKEWGPAEYQKRAQSALDSFVKGSCKWMSVEHFNGPDAVQAQWTHVYGGKSSPSVGIIASMNV
jgi:hypothetical protein